MEWNLLLSITGTHINYYFICQRKLWLFSRGLVMEQTSDTVLLGKLIDESSYARKEKQIEIDDTIAIDWIDSKNGVLHEVKKSDSLEDAHRWQVLYYLWYLKQKGVLGLKGELDYPKLKQKVSLELNEQRVNEITGVLKKIEEVVASASAPEKKSRHFCKACSYFELCWV